MSETACVVSDTIPWTNRPMLPTFDMLPPTTRIELEYLGEGCVRLVEWTSSGRSLVLTADPRDAEDLQRLLEIPEVLFRAQAGIDLETVWAGVRGRRRDTHRSESK